jgi:hypothetical protein
LFWAKRRASELPAVDFLSLFQFHFRRFTCARFARNLPLIFDALSLSKPYLMMMTMSAIIRLLLAALIAHSSGFDLIY